MDSAAFTDHGHTGFVFCHKLDWYAGWTRRCRNDCYWNIFNCNGGPMDLRDSLYLLGIIVLVFIAGIAGHWDYLGHMLDGAVLMFLYLKGKEK